MNKLNIINFFWFQLLWFVAVIGAAHPPWWVLAIPLIILYLYLMRHYITLIQHAVALMSATMGLFLDSLWVQFDIIHFNHHSALLSIPPVWICCLWYGLMVTFNFSLRWMQDNLLRSGVMAFFMAPVSYYTAESLGALEVCVSFFHFMLTIGISWIFVIPLMLYFNLKLNHQVTH